MKKKVAFKTLGCRLNQFETDSIATDFYNAGYEIVEFAEEADVYVVNTCTVTNQGDHKSKYAINKAVHSKTGSLIVVTGCMAESQKQYLENRKDISYIVDNKSKVSILPLVEAHFNGELVNQDLFKKDIFGFSVAEKSFHTRSMIKIQDGCNNFCSFCIVPMVRGKALSRNPDDIMNNIRKVLDTGFKEIVLTGVNISRYEFGNMSFSQLLNQILSIKGDFRVRISSVEPEGFDDMFFDLFTNNKLCPHLHLCLQSGSDKILMQMRRTYNTGSYLKIIEKLKSKYPLFNFTTDIMVGFPGETEEDFQSTCNILNDVGFSHVHTFKYSVRKGTRAERMPEHIAPQVKQQRSEIIRKLADNNKEAYRTLFIGKTQSVLVEKVSKNGLASGYGENYVPVEFKVPDPEKNYFKSINIKNIGSVSQDFILKG